MDGRFGYDARVPGSIPGVVLIFFLPQFIVIINQLDTLIIGELYESHISIFIADYLQIMDRVMKQLHPI